MRRSMCGPFLAALVMAMPAYAQQTSGGGAKARAAMKDRDGKDVGTVTMTQYPGAVVIRGELSNLEPGWRAIHVHEAGRCEPPFESAGGHFNPGDHKHGLDQPRSHAGDLPNIYVHQNGTARFELVTAQFTVAAPQLAGSSAPAAANPPAPADASQPVPVFDQDGAAIIVHAGPDDYVTDPSGNAGDRIACGVLERQ